MFDELDLDSPVANLNAIKICTQYNNQYKYKTPGGGGYSLKQPIQGDPARLQVYERVGISLV